MASEQTAVVEAMETSAPNAPEVQNNGHDSEPEADVSPTKKAKVDESDESQVKRRSSGRQKKNRDEEMLAEAKKLCGELDTSGGRSMRKRAEPPKSIEKKKEPVTRRPSKKSLEKGDDKSKTKDAAENGTAEDEDKVDKSDDAKQDDDEETKKEETKKDETNSDEAVDNTTSANADTNDKPSSETVGTDEKAGSEPVVAPVSTEENKSAVQTTDGLVNEAQNGENGDSSAADAAATKE